MRLSTQSEPDPSEIFSPHPNLSEVVNREILRSEFEGGVYLTDVPAHNTLQIETENRDYMIMNCGHGEALIWGHPVYCPNPVRVRIAGSNWGGSMLKVGFIGRGMRLEFCHPRFPTPIVTSRIRQIKEIEGGGPRS